MVILYTKTYSQKTISKSSLLLYCYVSLNVDVGFRQVFIKNELLCRGHLGGDICSRRLLRRAASDYEKDMRRYLMYNTGWGPLDLRKDDRRKVRARGRQELKS
jgi:hypothetical protein